VVLALSCCSSSLPCLLSSSLFLHPSLSLARSHFDSVSSHVSKLGLVLLCAVFLLCLFIFCLCLIFLFDLLSLSLFCLSVSLLLLSLSICLSSPSLALTVFVKLAPPPPSCALHPVRRRVLFSLLFNRSRLKKARWKFYLFFVIGLLSPAFVFVFVLSLLCLAFAFFALRLSLS
jgi:hypothetical protein